MTRQQQIIVGVIIGVIVLGGLTAALIIGLGGEKEEETIIVEQPQEQPESQQPQTGAGPEGGDSAMEAPSSAPGAEAGRKAEVGVKERAAAGQRPERGQKTDQTDSQRKPTAAQQLDKITSGELGKPAMVELGADWCPPCRQMKPIISDLKSSYADKVEILTIDVDANPDIARQYSVESIPVQLFFDKNGKQVSRHVGFYPKDEIIGQFSKMGIQRPSSGE